MQCAICQKQIEGDEIKHVFITALSSEEQPEHQEEWVSCQRCKTIFETPTENTFQEIDGPSYTDEKRPPFWYNDTPLHYEHYHVAYGQLPYLQKELPLLDPERYDYFIKENVLDTNQLPLHIFPLIEDFEILLERLTTRYKNEEELTSSDIFVWLFSPSRGYLAHIREHDTYRELSRPNFVIPHGDFQTPYADLDQGWHILLAENEMFVYILTGIWELNEGYQTWFKVEKNQYYSQWERAVQRCRDIVDRETSINGNLETD